LALYDAQDIWKRGGNMKVLRTTLKNTSQLGSMTQNANAFPAWMIQKDTMRFCTLTTKVVVDIFCDYITQQKLVIQSIQNNMPITFCISMDTTKWIQKRTTKFVMGGGASHVRSLENGMHCIMGCNGTVLSQKVITNDSLDMVRPQLLGLKLRALEQGCVIKYIVVDNCCQA
jgi:hypothetical protein